MADVYCETLSLCPTCGIESPAWYEEYPDRMELCVRCAEHGVAREPVECDTASFRKYYEMDYPRPARHLVLPVTYRCNMNCRYCYSLSNAGVPIPEDRMLGMPVWQQRTVDDVAQVQSLVPLIDHYRRIVFEVTLRAVKPMGAEYPSDNVYVSQLVDALGQSNRCLMGTTPFNRWVRIARRPVKVCSWINDVRRTDPLDSGYVISSDELTTFHRGMKLDEVLLTRSSSLARTQ